MAHRLGVRRRAGVGRADQVVQPDPVQHVEGGTVREQVEVAGHDHEVAGFPGRLDEGREPLGLLAPGRGVALACRVAQAVQLHDADGAAGRTADDPHRLHRARPVGDGPLVVVDEAAVHERGRHTYEGQLLADVRAEAEVLLVAAAASGWL
jgi:hypothetical protein